ncbi:SLBB domain-containing protein [Aridibaculum aurantiacum]|uniref:SLBB domain-containing protein n=1 Tax=Aridibaculum aurantiacum TaxID=2810307 RepID=UPI001A9691FE|nr:SLBB domain-containing protein [Aridibaculum aurantiacum]
MSKLKIFLTLVLLAFSWCLFAQIPNLPSNLYNVRSSDIPEERVVQIAAYLRENKVSDQQAYEQMLSRGMLASEAAALRTRIQKALQQTNTTDNPNDNNRSSLDNSDKTRYNETQESIAEVKNPQKIFGFEIFNLPGGVFEPNLKIATPVGYVLGPDDQIILNIYGYQEANYTLTVSPEGSIIIPNVGVIYVAGLTLEQATDKIRNKLATSGYSLIRSGLTKINLSVGRIRSIRVTVLGEVKKPGSYTLPSLATAFNALYLSGGPNEIGSFREIELIRGGKKIQLLDIYDVLLKGDQAGNLQLRDQDVIRVPAYKVRVGLAGEVKRPGLFEVLPGETFENLLGFAGGFSDSAYTASVTAYKSTDTEKRIIDIEKAQFSTYTPSRAESFLVKKLVERYTNRVTVSGAVYLPGDYELSPGMTLYDLLVRAQGLKEDAFAKRGIIMRQKADLTPEYLAFNPAEVMQGQRNLELRRNDEVIITSNTLLREERQVSITGEVRRVGNYPYVENMTLKDLILLAGGFTDAAIPQKIEVARRIRKDSFGVADIQIADVIDVTSIADLEQNGRDIQLTPYDAVVVRRNPGYQAQVNVRVEGEVIFPGPYVLRNKNERVSDVIRRAGGLTNQAYKMGGYLTRVNNHNVVNQLNSEKVTKIQEQLKDSTGKVEQEVSRPVDQIAINLSSILANPGGKEDIVMEDGDILNIPKEKMEVRISGEVLFPTRVVYEEDMDLKDYIGRAGGFTDNARKARVYVLYPNGNAAKTSNFLFFKSFPRVTPGAEIIVPKKHETEKRRMTTGEIVGITTALTSFAGVLLTLIINLK